jgi:hypothetical protein
MAFFTAAVFSAVAESVWLWIVPTLLLLAAIIYRTARHRWFPLRMLWNPTAATLLVCASLLLCGRGGAVISGSSDTVVFGHEPSQYVALYEKSTMGTLYGKTLRQNQDELSELGITLIFDPDHLPARLTNRILILGAELPAGYEDQILAAAKSAESVVLLSPRYFPQQLPLESSKVTAFFGDFSQSPAIHSWSQISNFKQRTGMGDFFPDWPVMLTQSNQQIHGQAN